MSSRVREGYSASSSSTVSSFASMRTIWWTGIRVPLTQAWPWQIFGSMEILSNGTFVPSTISLILGRHSSRESPGSHEAFVRTTLPYPKLLIRNQLPVFPLARADYTLIGRLFHTVSVSQALYLIETAEGL